MTLRELINTLATLNQTLLLPKGFHNPHSYRGYYAELAFEPKNDVYVWQMLRDAEQSVGMVYDGWKGGEYYMCDDTPVWLAFEGSCGHEITQDMLSAWISFATCNGYIPAEDDKPSVSPPSVTFSINRYDSEGGVLKQGISLHFGNTSVFVAETPQQFGEFVKEILAIERELQSSVSPSGNPQ